MLESNHTFDWQNKEIMDFETNCYKRLILKTIYIKIQENGLNSVSNIEYLDPSYFNLLLNFLTKNSNTQKHLIY